MEFQTSPGRIWAGDAAGRLVAEITFPLLREGVAGIDHTFVDDSLRGRGVAALLVEAAADQLRARGLKAVPLCSYAQKWFSQHPEQADLLAE